MASGWFNVGSYLDDLKQSSSGEKEEDESNSVAPNWFINIQDVEGLRWKIIYRIWPLYMYILHCSPIDLVVLYIEFRCYFGFCLCASLSLLYSLLFLFLLCKLVSSFNSIFFFFLSLGFSFSKNVLIKLRNKVGIRAFDTNQIEMLYENTQTHHHHHQPQKFLSLANYSEECCTALPNSFRMKTMWNWRPLNFHCSTLCILSTLTECRVCRYTQLLYIYIE